MNAADLSARTATLIRKQADAELELGAAKHNLELVQKGRHTVAAVTFATRKVETVQARLDEITKAIHGRGPIPAWIALAS